MQRERIEPLTARIGQACYNCFKEQDVTLSRCTGCRRVSYCSSDCQKDDWRKHKPMCKALSSIEKGNPLAAASLLFSLSSLPTTDLNALHNMAEAHGDNIRMFCERALKRPVTTFEKNLIGWEPRCLACTRTDQLIRIEATSGDGVGSTEQRSITACPDCKTSFYCSPSHWVAARALHHGPCEDSPEGALSQCEMNRQVRMDIGFSEAMVVTSASGQFMWAPERVKAPWAPVDGLTWDGEFAEHLRSSVGIPANLPIAPWIRAASDNLTIPMTILYALEKLNDTDAWTKKPTLTIHIIGAATMEMAASMVFEEILHRLPEVKTLKLVLCGPELTIERGGTIVMETCPDCTQHSRQRVHQFAIDTYHAFVQKQGPRFEKPDLAIAFNSGASQEAVASWPATFKMLVERKIPSVFTAFNREEAVEEARLLRSAGAALHPDLGPAKNPWGSLKAIPEPNKVYGFYAVNAWLAGGFR